MDIARKEQMTTLIRKVTFQVASVWQPKGNNKNNQNFSSFFFFWIAHQLKSNSRMLISISETVHLFCHMLFSNTGSVE